MLIGRSKITRNNQVTIPKILRKMLHLKTGDTVYFGVESGSVILIFDRKEPLSQEEEEEIKALMERLHES